MPELPEVQTVVDALNRTRLINTPITSVRVYTLKLLKNASLKLFSNFLINEKVIYIDRIGKYLVFKLTNNKILVIHLRMEGKLFFENRNFVSSNKKHLRLEIYLKNYHVLRYYDSRMFGTFHIYHYDEYLKAKHITKLALDPLNAKFDAKYLNSKLSHINRAIKTAILDQTNVAGIGNIYADEILFLTKIHPLTIAKHLNLKQYELIVKYAKQVLKQAIKYGGTTIATYKSDARHIGQYQNKLLVHMRANQPCKVCHTLIEKIKVNGRGTYFCPKCQKKY